MSNSENLCRLFTKDKHYGITVASWDSLVTGQSYEVGLRDLQNPERFEMLAMYLKSDRSAHQLGEAVIKALNFATSEAEDTNE